MKIELSHIYSKIDKRHEFGLVFQDVEMMQVYIRWVYYYLGAEFGEPKRVVLYPFAVGKNKPIRTYKFYNNAQRQAKLIINSINTYK